MKASYLLIHRERNTARSVKCEPCYQHFHFHSLWIPSSAKGRRAISATTLTQILQKCSSRLTRSHIAAGLLFSLERPLELRSAFPARFMLGRKCYFNLLSLYIRLFMSQLYPIVRSA